AGGSLRLRRRSRAKVYFAADQSRAVRSALWREAKAIDGLLAATMAAVVAMLDERERTIVCRRDPQRADGRGEKQRVAVADDGIPADEHRLDHSGLGERIGVCDDETARAFFENIAAVQFLAVRFGRIAFGEIDEEFRVVAADFGLEHDGGGLATGDLFATIDEGHRVAERTRGDVGVTFVAEKALGVFRRADLDEGGGAVKIEQKASAVVV